MRWKTTIVAALATGWGFMLMGCLRGERQDALGAAAADAEDRAYLRLRSAKEGCPRDQQAGCCEGLKARMDSALAAGDGREAAHALDLLAIGCPQLRSVALAALDSAGKATGPAPPARPAAIAADGLGRARVAYQLDLPPGDRLYWASAFFDGKHPPGTRLPPGLHSLDVELHIVPVEGMGKDQLFRVRASGQVEIKPGREHEVIVVVKRPAGAAAADPFAVTFVSGGLAPSETAPARATLQPAAAAALRKSVGAPRLPSELNRGQQEWSLIELCVDAAGKLETIEPLRSPHPRHTALMLDIGRRAEHRPHSIDGRPVPYCYPLLVNWNL
jgi:hypothetical protein